MTDSEISLQILGTRTKSADLSTGLDPLIYERNFVISDVDVTQYAATRTASTSGDTFSLAGGIDDVFGDEVHMGAVHSLNVSASSENTVAVYFSANSSGGFTDWLSSTAGGVKLPPGFGFSILGEHSDAYQLTAAAAELVATTTAGTAAYQIVVVGEKPKTLLAAIEDAGAASNLVLCLDAGAAASFGGGGIWRDMRSVAPLVDFYLGSTAGVEATDPSFGGVIGRRSDDDVFDFNGSQFCTLAVPGAAPAWAHELHRNSARWSYFAIVYLNSTAHGSLFGTLGNSDSAVGTMQIFQDGQKPQIFVSGSTAVTPVGNSADALALGQWHCVACTIDEAGGTAGSFHWSNGGFLQVAGDDEFSGAFSSPQSGAATYPIQVGAAGNNQLPLGNGNRLAAIAVWQGGVKSAAEFDSVYERIRHRFGL